MKLRRSTVILMVLSWVLFLGACFFAYRKLDQAYTAKLTNEKIFKENQDTKDQETSSKAVQETSDLDKGISEDERARAQAAQNFVETYYAYMQKHDLAKLKTMVEDQQEMTQRYQSMRKYVEEYQDLDYLTQRGADQNSYLVYVTYQMKIKNIKTPAPGMTAYYVVKSGNSFRICNNDKRDTKNIENAKKQSQNSREVRSLIRRVNKKYERAIRADRQLKEFLEDH